MAFARHSVLPGFGLGLGYGLFWLSLIVLLPLAALVMKLGALGWAGFAAAVFNPRVLSALGLAFGASALAALINAVMGFLVAWVLVRYPFPGKRLVDALVDLPFALPTAVAGIALATLYAPNGWFGQWLEPLGIKVAFTPLGILVALTFVSLPFVVRTVQPVLEDLESRWQIFRHVLFPALTPALLTGATLAFARASGEFGSVIFIAGNLPMVSEIAPLLIIGKLEQYDYLGATAIAVAMLVIAFVLLFVINGIQWWANRRHGVR